MASPFLRAKKMKKKGFCCLQSRLFGPCIWATSYPDECQDVGIFSGRIHDQYLINSLLLIAIYGVVESASAALFGPVIGQWVDKLSYVKVLHSWTLTQNLSFAVTGGTVLTLLPYSDLKSTNEAAFVSLVVVADICGAVVVLSTLAGTILIEREWVVVISEGHPTEVLTNMNSVIRRIDLVCELVAPVVAGFLTSFASSEASAVFLVSWNLVSVCLQYWLLMSVYKGIPGSSQERNKDPKRNGDQ